LDQLGLRIAAYALEEESALPWFSLAGEGQRHRAAGLSVEAHEPLHAMNGAVDTTVNSAFGAGEIEQPV
jgi:hypothetical protein